LGAVLLSLRALCDPSPALRDQDFACGPSARFAHLKGDSFAHTRKTAQDWLNNKRWRLMSIILRCLFDVQNKTFILRHLMLQLEHHS